MPLDQFESFLCPYCGQTNELLLDFSGGASQNLVVDCEICCSPIAVRIKIRGDQVEIDVRRENG